VSFLASNPGFAPKNIRGLGIIKKCAATPSVFLESHERMIETPLLRKRAGFCASICNKMSFLFKTDDL
jgi:hypothetical protein